MYGQTDKIERVQRALAMARVGSAIREHREKKGMTLRKLAMAIAVSPAFLSDVEHGRRTTRKLDRIEKVLGLKPAALYAVAGICYACGGSGFVGGITIGGRRDG